MKLSNKWFTTLSETEEDRTLFVNGREDLGTFKQSGKFKERVEITWPYEGDSRGLPSDKLAEQMEEVGLVIQKRMEKDKLAIMTGVYTGNNEKVWIFYTRTTRAFGDYLNEALAPFELLPITLYCEFDPDWDEYQEMLELRQWATHSEG